MRTISRHGFSFIPIIIGMALVAIFFPAASQWLLSMFYLTNDTRNRIEMENFLYDYWGQLNSANSDDFEEMLNSLGASKTKTVSSGNYILSLTFGNKQKYENGVCGGGAASDSVPACIPVSVSISDSTGKSASLSFSANKIIVPGADSDNFPKGSIVPYIGNLANIPKKWYLCDGTHGTPNLTGRFLAGAGGKYSPKSFGGTATLTMTAKNMPRHQHATSYLPYNYGASGSSAHWNSHGGNSFRLGGGITSYTGSSAPFSIVPSYFTVYYIMKVG